jgi:hypothetical protein
LLRNLGPPEKAGILDRQRKLGVLATYHQVILIRDNFQFFIPTGAQNGADMQCGQDYRPRLVYPNAQDTMSDPYLQVGPHEHGTVFFIRDQFHVLQDWLGTAGWHNTANHRKRAEQRISVAKRPHALSSTRRTILTQSA